MRIRHVALKERTMKTTKSSYDVQSATTFTPAATLRVRLAGVMAVIENADGSTSLDIATRPHTPEIADAIDNVRRVVPGLTDNELDELADEIHLAITKKSLGAWFRSNVTIEE